MKTIFSFFASFLAIFGHSQPAPAAVVPLNVAATSSVVISVAPTPIPVATSTPTPVPTKKVVKPVKVVATVSVTPTPVPVVTPVVQPVVTPAPETNKRSVSFSVVRYYSHNDLVPAFDATMSSSTVPYGAIVFDVSVTDSSGNPQPHTFWPPVVLNVSLNGVVRDNTIPNPMIPGAIERFFNNGNDPIESEGHKYYSYIPTRSGYTTFTFALPSGEKSSQSVLIQ